MKTLELKSFGPILGGQVEFGDLTVLVGPQASGKSLFVQMYKAIQDAGAIRENLRQYGFRLGLYRDSVPHFLAMYFGGGMQSLWKEGTAVLVDGKALDFRREVVNASGILPPKEAVFLVPAQRVLALQDGWPRPFLGYAAGDPYCLRNFSEALRKLMEAGLGSEKATSLRRGRLIPEVGRLVDEGVYVSGRLMLLTDGMRKQIALIPTVLSRPLPYNAWSAGQREFTPLLLGLHWLIPSGKTGRREAIEKVVVEEPEMGLHPRAIMSFCLLVLELLARGYKVILSTHSPVVLDVVWALRELRDVGEKAGVSALKEVFRIKRLGQPIRRVLAGALRMDCRTYYFRQSSRGVRILDISSLDPSDKDPDISGWGGLSGFSGDTADIVGRALSGRKG
jgi:hypothetical protein